MKTSTKSIQLYLDIAGVIDFNQNLGMGGDWGSYSYPFDASQFLTIGVNDETPSANNIPKLQPATMIPITVIPKMDSLNGYSFEMDHLRMQLIGELVLEEKTPRNSWGEVLDLDATDGAIGEGAFYFLGQVNGENKYELTTAKQFPDLPHNISYRLKFSIQQGTSIKYCTVDPLLKSHSDG